MGPRLTAELTRELARITADTGCLFARDGTRCRGARADLGSPTDHDQYVHGTRDIPLFSSSTPS